MAGLDSPRSHEGHEFLIVHEDDDLLVVDKPGNMVCHSAQRLGQVSLANWVRERGVTPRFVNRLDRETSGLVLISKNERTAKLLGKQVLRREVGKEYVAICWGVFERDAGMVDQPIGLTTDAAVYTKRVVDVVDGKESLTEFEVIQRLSRTGTAKRQQFESDEKPLSSAATGALQTGFSVVRLVPQTGRTHQLRVHLSWLGHPIVGDKIYGPDERLYLEFIEKGVTDEMLTKLLLPRHALHAATLTVRHPATQERVTFRAELPADMRGFIEDHA